MTLSTTSGRGVRKSEEYNSGWNMTSAQRNLKCIVPGQHGAIGTTAKLASRSQRRYRISAVMHEYLYISWPFATHPTGHGVLAGIPRKVFVWIRVVFLEFLHYVLRNVCEALLDGLSAGAHTTSARSQTVRDPTHVRLWSSGGMWAVSPRSRSSWSTKSVRSRPAIGTCLIDDPIT